jgi:hypothetical protein
MMDVFTAADEYRIRDGALEFSFQNAGDRWRHTLRLGNAAASALVLTSVEGGPDDLEIPSPAFQEVQFERLGDQGVEFQLFGRSAKGIYSAAVRYDAATHAFDFDLCVRGPSSEVAPLCTINTYDVAAPAAPSAAPLEAGGLRIVSSSGHQLRIVPCTATGLAQGSCRWIPSAPPRIVVGAQSSAPLATSGKSISIRWRQQILCESAGG